MAIYAALRHRKDFANALAEVVGCGGDTDTMGAITGALVGARVGPAGIPESWRRNLKDYPCSIGFLDRLAAALHRQRETGTVAGSIPPFWPAIPFRNLVFLSVVLAHGFRRLLPPY